jgi:hypothetical protein
MSRNRRAGVEDRWRRTVYDADGNAQTVPSANDGKGSRWRARYVDENGREHEKVFARKTDAQQWINKQISDQVTGAWTDPARSVVTFGAMAERWLSTKATRAAKTVAGYRSLLDTVVLPRWRDVPLRDVRFDDLQVWVTGLSVDGSVRFGGEGLSASRVRQAHQLVGAVLKFAVARSTSPRIPPMVSSCPGCRKTSSVTSPMSSCTGSRSPRGGCGRWSWCSGTAAFVSARRPRCAWATWTSRHAGYGCVDR